MCETVVMAVKKVLSNDRVDRDIVHIVEKSCGMLPAKYSNRVSGNGSSSIIVMLILLRDAFQFAYSFINILQKAAAARVVLLRKGCS